MTVRHQDKSSKQPNEISPRKGTGARQGSEEIFLDRDRTHRGGWPLMPDLISENLFDAAGLILQELGGPKGPRASSLSCRS